MRALDFLVITLRAFGFLVITPPFGFLVITPPWRHAGTAERWGEATPLAA